VEFAATSKPEKRIRYSGNEMKENKQQRLSRIQRWIQSFCGIYTRVASRFHVDRSYVSRVARGERTSPEISQALITEFERIQRDTPK
jgi:predicted XRE-type DNA-binding protein